MSSSRMEDAAQLISLYELIPFGLFLLAICTQSPFLAILGVATISKQVPEKWMKRFVPFPKSVRDRPPNAKNCNVLNKGGSYTGKPGYPSGHTTTAWFLFMYMYLQLVQNNEGTNAWNVTCVTGVYAILVPLSRILLHCHTPDQISGGMALGTIWAFLFMWIEQKYLMPLQWYKEDKRRIFQVMSSEMWETFRKKYPKTEEKMASYTYLIAAVCTLVLTEAVTKLV